MREPWTTRKRRHFASKQQPTIDSSAIDADLPGDVVDSAPQDSEDVARCVCRFAGDDGTMIECVRCAMWQHEKYALAGLAPTEAADLVLDEYL